jgi:hypothetical protein
MNPQQQHEYDVAVQQGHKHFYDHIPLYNSEMLDLLNAVKKKTPELTVVGGGRQLGDYVNGKLVYTYCELELAYVNMPNEVVGSIGYDGEVYTIYSRLIENARFSRWSGRDYHTKKSKHMNNIVKEAPKYLLPTQFKEVVDESSNNFYRFIQEIRTKAVYGMRSTLNNTTDSLRDELFHMVEQGYKPKNACFASAMAYVVESREEYERNENYDPAKAFVWIKSDSVAYKIDKGEVLSVATTNDLPEEIRGKLFVLMVTDHNTFIDEVGMKAGDNKFWVIL